MGLDSFLPSVDSSLRMREGQEGGHLEGQVGGHLDGHLEGHLGRHQEVLLGVCKNLEGQGGESHPLAVTAAWLRTKPGSTRRTQLWR